MKICIQLTLLALWSSTTSGLLLDPLLKREVCCDLIGCFNNSAPFNQLPLPDCAPGDYKIKYTMYTREQPTDGQIFDIGTVPLNFNGLRRTVFVIHGFIENEDYKWMTTIKDAFLYRENINVVIVDWSAGGCNPYYLQPASNTRTAGAYTALVIQFLLNQPNTDSSRFLCAGHSLGSHVCGHTGMKMPASQKLGRIIGMDPAGPGFESSPDVKVGLNPSAATFVDNIHTGSILGTHRPLGHIDFYPTGYKLALDLSFNSAFEYGVICGMEKYTCSYKTCVIFRCSYKTGSVNDYVGKYKVAGVLCAHKRSVDFMIASLLGKEDCFSTDVHCVQEVNDLDRTLKCKREPGCDGFMGYRADQSCLGTSPILALEVPPNAPFCPRAAP